MKLSRRRFAHLGIAAAASHALMARAQASDFAFRYMVASSMYGDLSLKEIVPEIPKTGSSLIDLWPKKHGTQREEVDEMGVDAFRALLKEHGVTLGGTTRYDLGPFKLTDEFSFVSDLGGDLIVCGGKGPKDLSGAELKAAVKEFAELLKPHADLAAEKGVRIGIENHANNLIDSPDSLKWLAEMGPENVGIALAPYHLEVLGEGADDLADLIRALGDRHLLFYAWQHGMGCHEKLPKEQELLQMPGRGELDFAPIVAALKDVNFKGYTEIFMHPVPRGIPILPTAAETTAEINRGRDYLSQFI